MKSPVAPSALRRLARLSAAALLALLLPAAGAGRPLDHVANPLPGRSSAPLARDSALEARIGAVVERPAFRRAHWGIEVRDPATGRAVYRLHADRLFVPASSLKLVVAATAAHLLPADYRYRTSVLADGELRGGTLEGELVLVGRGDPTLSARYFPTRTAAFEAMADSLVARGVRRVRGVTADDSWFDDERVRGDWEAYDLRWWYGAPVGALGFNDNAVDLRVEPGAVGSAARITGEPAGTAWTLENRTRTVAATAPHTLDFDRVPGTTRILAYGDIPAGTGPRTEHVAVLSPARYAGTVFREALERRGIRVERAEVRVVSDPRLSAAGRARVLYEHRSPPLPQVIGPILLNSQNWFAEQLLKTVGREARGEGSWAAGLAAERDFLVREVGIDPGEVVLRDASGLSSGNLVTPHALVRLLDYVRRTPRQEVVRRALPVSGRTGSLQGRFPDLPGRVAAKTGYIGNVDSLSGFVTRDDGRVLVFAVIVNGSGLPSSRVKPAIDDVVRAIARVR